MKEETVITIIGVIAGWMQIEGLMKGEPNWKSLERSLSAIVESQTYVQQAQPEICEFHGNGCGYIRVNGVCMNHEGKDCAEYTPRKKQA